MHITNVAEENNRKCDKPKKSTQKRTTRTARLQNSLKLSGELLDGLKIRTNILNQYYKAKMDYLTHRKKYEEEKLKETKRANDLKQELVNELQEIRNILHEFV